MTIVELHGKTDCPYCEKAKAFLTAAKIPFTVVLHDDETNRWAFYDKLGLVGDARFVPQVLLIDTHVIGGYSALLRSGIASLFPLPEEGGGGRVES